MKHWFVFCGNSLLLTPGNKLLEADDLPLPKPEENNIFSLKDTAGNSYGAFSVNEIPTYLSLKAIPLRESFSVLTWEIYQLAGKARELVYWDSQTHFCGSCGHQMTRNTEISKRCAKCGNEVWPALNIAIIVAISKGDQILLVQSRNFRRDYMGLVAGFVETGETLEEAVRREVKEETSIDIKNIKYFNSQSWPYPSGLMVGFTADYASGTLHLQLSELKKGGWFTYQDLQQTQIPGKESIARKLIDNWLAQHSPA